MKRILLSIIILLISGCTFQITGLTISDHWRHDVDLDDGWMSRAEGSVKNDGKETATNVYVDCIAKRKGSVIGAQRVYLGSLGPGEEKGFETVVDYLGSGAVSGNCNVVCSTCS